MKLILFYYFNFYMEFVKFYSISTKNISKNLYRQTQEQFATVFFFIYAYIVNAVIILFILYLTHSRRWATLYFKKKLYRKILSFAFFS